MATRKENTFHDVRFITHGSPAGIAVFVIVRLRFHHQFRVKAEMSICVEGSLFLFLHAQARRHVRIVMDIRTCGGGHPNPTLYLQFISPSNEVE